jgi:hypothetical protein
MARRATGGREAAFSPSPAFTIAIRHPSIHPWRPFVYVPRAWEIDALIQKVLGREMFARITLK